MKHIQKAGIQGSTPIRVCENGWPTGPDRPERRQAEVLDTVLRGVHARRHELNVTHWELFALRDADSARANPFYQFGIVRDDYSANRRSSDCARPSPSSDEASLGRPDQSPRRGHLRKLE
jgi:hypothetical protein